MFSFSSFWSAPAVKEDPTAILRDIVTFSDQCGKGENKGVELRQALETFYKNFALKELDIYISRPNFVGAVLTQHAWPQDDTRRFTSKQDLGYVKAELLEAMLAIGDMDLKINALLQSLCTCTFLGKIFYMPRYFTSTAVDKGSLAEITTQLEQAILKMSSQGSSYQLLEDTKLALQKEVENNANFHAILIKYPNLQLLVSNVAPMQSRKLTI